MRVLEIYLIESRITCTNGALLQTELRQVPGCLEISQPIMW